MAEGGACTARDTCDYMMCEKHPDTKVEVYCEQHTVVCCMTCAWKYHHDCRPKPCMLEEAKQKMQDEHVGLIDQLMTCSETCNEEVDALEKKLEVLNDAETSVRTKFSKIKDEVIAKLGDMEQELNNDIKEYICDITTSLTYDLDHLKQQKQDIHETKQTIQNLLQTSDPSMVAAFVKLKRIIKTIDNYHSQSDIKVPTFKVSKEVHNFLDCSLIGSFRSSTDDYENVDSSADASKEECSKVEDDETLMSDILPDDKETKPRPKQERSGITFGKIFRLFKFRGNSQTPAKSPSTNPIPLPLAASGNIEDEEWYHGDITRDVANARLLGNGDYLLRAKPNSATGGADYVLSVCSKIQHHAFIKSVKGGWKFKGRRFATIEDLIQHLHHTMTPLISASHKVVLQSPVSSKPLSEAEEATEATAATDKVRKSRCDDDGDYEDVFDTGERILRKAAEELTIDEVIANFDFNANANDELSFQEGDHLRIVSTKEDANWWKARNKNGKVGLIPKNYVTKVGEQQTVPNVDDATTEEDDSTSHYELWAPSPSAVCEYDCGDDFKWFHGCLPRENAEKRLTSDGDFLVRQHGDGAGKQYILSVFWGTPRHFRYKKPVSGYDQPFEYVIYLIGEEVPLNSKIDVTLRNPILKESWELRNDDITLLDSVGKGANGFIHKGFLKSSKPLQPPKQVALHVAQENMSEDAKKQFLGAAQILHEFDHPNIVKCLGIAMDYEPVIVATEYMAGGCLLNYLRGTSSISVRRKTEICANVAGALVYLQDKKCIHRDVSARKCLIGENNIVKLSDFMMCSRLDSLHSPTYKFLVAIKWTAPEVLHPEGTVTYSKAFQTEYKTLFSLKSDIWSFGVLMWEVFSQAKAPYSGLTNAVAVEKIIDGYRMPPPENTPQFIAELMTRCWNDDPDKRPNIKHIAHWLEAALRCSALETFALPPLPPPVSTRPRSSVSQDDSDVKKSSRRPELQSLKEKMRTRPLPPPPPDDTTDSERVQDRSPPPPPPSRRAPPPLPSHLDTDDEEEFEEPT